MYEAISDKQGEFDNKYIGSVEICNTLDITRVALFQGRRRGFLPPPIIVPLTNTFLWVRTDIRDQIAKWQKRLDQRRGKAD